MSANAKKSKYRGVFWCREKDRWRSRITLEGGKKRWLGTFENEEEAARAYDRAAKEVQPFPVLNFLEDGRVNPDRKLKHRGWGTSRSAASTSRYRGVSWESTKGYWTAIIKVKRKKIRLGNFMDEVKAAKAYDQAAKMYYDDPVLNFPDDPAPSTPMAIMPGFEQCAQMMSAQGLPPLGYMSAHGAPHLPPVPSMPMMPLPPHTHAHAQPMAPHTHPMPPHTHTHMHAHAGQMGEGMGGKEQGEEEEEEVDVEAAGYNDNPFMPHNPQQMNGYPQQPPTPPPPHLYGHNLPGVSNGPPPPSSAPGGGGGGGGGGSNNGAGSSSSGGGAAMGFGASGGGGNGGGGSMGGANGQVDGSTAGVPGVNFNIPSPTPIGVPDPNPGGSPDTGVNMLMPPVGWMTVPPPPLPPEAIANLQQQQFHQMQQMQSGGGDGRVLIRKVGRKRTRDSQDDEEETEQDMGLHYLMSLRRGSIGSRSDQFDPQQEPTQGLPPHHQNRWYGAEGPNGELLGPMMMMEHFLPLHPSPRHTAMPPGHDIMMMMPLPQQQPQQQQQQQAIMMMMPQHGQHHPQAAPSQPSPHQQQQQQQSVPASLPPPPSSDHQPQHQQDTTQQQQQQQGLERELMARQADELQQQQQQGQLAEAETAEQQQHLPPVGQHDALQHPFTSRTQPQSQQQVTSLLPPPHTAHTASLQGDLKFGAQDTGSRDAVHAHVDPELNVPHGGFAAQEESSEIQSPPSSQAVMAHHQQQQEAGRNEEHGSATMQNL